MKTTKNAANHSSTKSLHVPIRCALNVVFVLMILATR
jgi:hypothetical protein